MTTDILTAYADGDVTDLEALRALSMQLGEVESDLEPLEAESAALRARLDAVRAALGLALELPAPGPVALSVMMEQIVVMEPSAETFFGSFGHASYVTHLTQARLVAALLNALPALRAALEGEGNDA